MIEEGTIQDNEGSPIWDVNAGTGGAWVYVSSRQTPANHDFSPPMTLSQVQTVIADSDTTESDWLNAHPAAVKTWLNNRTSTQRANHRTGCQKLALL